MIIRKADNNDSSSIITFFKKYPEVAFEEWQNNIFLLLKNSILHGVLFGGIMGSRATINHFAIDNEYRKMGYGNKLFSTFKNYLAKNNIFKIFLFVDSNNTRALTFYKKNGFKILQNEHTLELNCINYP